MIYKRKIDWKTMGSQNALPRAEYFNKEFEEIKKCVNNLGNENLDRANNLILPDYDHLWDVVARIEGSTGNILWDHSGKILEVVHSTGLLGSTNSIYIDIGTDKILPFVVKATPSNPSIVPKILTYVIATQKYPGRLVIGVTGYDVAVKSIAACPDFTIMVRAQV